VIDKIPDDDKTVNYIIINRQANCFTNRTVISFHGSENIVFIGDGSKIGNGEIRFYNSNGLVVLNDNNQHPNWFKVWLHSPSSWVYWGKNATSNGVICVTDNSKGIFVDDDCMFASNTWIRCSDMHDIFDIHSSETINDSADVLIESHVWVAQESLILKGAKIGAGSIIAARSLVTGEIPKFTLAMGSPAKIVKNNVSWYRNKLKPVRESTRLFVENQLNT
jgi:carbonic anhydrase/acetyltransferase-like protein (isoleucine patch superfamily)